jgi:hypothetical protein
MDHRIFTQHYSLQQSKSLSLIFLTEPLNCLTLQLPPSMFRHSPSNPQDCRPPEDDALASVSRSIEADENHGHQPTEAQDDAGGLHAYRHVQ